jgi:hypothetical protein
MHILVMMDVPSLQLRSNTMLIKEQANNKDETIIFIDKVLQANGIDCDIRIAEVSHEQLKEFLKVSQYIKKKKVLMKTLDKDTIIPQN